MCDRSPQETLSRRKVLKRMLKTSASAVVGAPIMGLPGSPSVAAVRDVESAISTTPGFSPRFFNASQIRKLDSLVETVIPTDDHSPGAKAAGVSKYIDYIVSNAKDDVKATWIKGLVAMDNLAQQVAGKHFSDCSGDQKNLLVERISQNEGEPTTAEERFFRTLKNATINGYYRSEIGIHQDLQYQGNFPQMEFPGCIRPEHTKS